MRNLFQTTSALEFSSIRPGSSLPMVGSSPTDATLQQSGLGLSALKPSALKPSDLRQSGLRQSGLGLSVSSKLSGLQAGEDYVADEVIIKFKDSADLVSSADLMARMAGAKALSDARGAGLERWSIGDLTVGEAIAYYSDHPAVEYIQPNYIIKSTAIPNDSDFDQLWGLDNTGQTGGITDADIDAPEAWDLQTNNNADNNAVIVGVIDSGVDYTHPDLVNNMWTNAGEIPNNGIDDDNNGYIDDYYGYDFANDDGDPFDDNRHGTHVAGTIAATHDNNLGVVGVSRSAQIMALKFLDASGSGTTFDAIEAIEYATMMGAHITNNSWGGSGFSQALRDAIAAAGDAGQLFVAAAGNSGLDNDIALEYPASYDADNIISVAATTASDGLADFSNYGATSVDLGAPGDDILSTVPGGDYATFSGTSMAAPHVTGVASLILAAQPDLTPAAVKQILLSSVDPVEALQGITVTGGRLNAYNALLTALALSTIEGRKWNDEDADGVWDEGELGLANWTLFLDENNNGILDAGETATVTDSDGHYSFSVQAGTYTVDQVLPLGWTQTYPTAGRYTITLGEQETATGLDFGSVLSNPVEIQGTKWHDLNEDGIQDGDEPGLGGWTIYLDTNQNDILDDGEQFTVTDANGNYAFTNLPPETYTVAAVTLAGWEQVFPAVGTLNEVFRADFSDADGNPSLDGFTIDNTGGAVAGLWHLSTGRGNQPGHSEADSLYFGAGEGPDGGGDYNVGATAGRVTSPTIDLTTVRGAELTFNYVLATEGFSPFDSARVLVASDGGEFEAIATNFDILQDPTLEWTSATLDLSDYTGHEIQIQFDFDTSDHLANNFEGWYIDDVVVNETGDGAYSLTLDPDQRATDINFGYRAGEGEISGTVWNDRDGDASQDPDEPGLDGWIIFLDQNQNGAIDIGEQSTVSAADGTYGFTNLVAGDYTIAQISPQGWQPTVPVAPELFRADFSDEGGNPSLDGFTIDNTGAAVDGLWHLSTGRGSQAGHSAADSLYFGTGETAAGGGNYNVGHTAGRVTSPVIDLSAVDGAELLFNYVLETEGLAPYDQASVLIAVDGGGFQEIASNVNSLQDPTSGWATASLDLTAYVGHDIQIQFDFDTLDPMANGFEGWYLDDVVVNATGGSNHKITLSAGERVTDINFGNQVLLGEITGQIWHDLDRDGIQEVNETGLENWTVFLDQNQNGVLDDGEVSTTSDAAGTYAFTDLTAGNYTVAQVLPNRWRQSVPDSSYEVDLEGGETKTGLNFGNYTFQRPPGIGDPPTPPMPVNTGESDDTIVGADPGVNMGLPQADGLTQLTDEAGTSPNVGDSGSRHSQGYEMVNGLGDALPLATFSIDRSQFSHLSSVPVMGPMPGLEDHFTWPGTTAEVQLAWSAWGMATSSFQPFAINQG